VRHGFGASQFALFRSEPNSRYFELFWSPRTPNSFPFLVG
jgi:hypothetical protein